MWSMAASTSDTTLMPILRASGIQVSLILFGGVVEVKALDCRAGDDAVRRGVGLQHDVRLGQSGGDLRQEFGGDILMNQ